MTETQQPPARLSPGDNAPDFTLPTDSGDEVSLSGLRGRKVIVYFYPAAMTAGCGLRGRRDLAGQAGQAREVPRA